MKQLEKEFNGRGEVRGFRFTQEMATDKAFMYRVTYEESQTPHYEVFQYKENTLYNCVSYPTSKAFGIWAKSTNSKEKANQYFNQYNQ